MKKTQQELIDELSEICEQLGWTIGIPLEEGDDSPVDGLLIGTESFITKVVLELNGEYEMFSKEMGEIVEGGTVESNKKKKQTMH